MNKKAYFFIDDTIWAFRDIARQKPASIFDQPFLALMKEAHDKYGMKVQLNLFYQTDFFYGHDEFSLAEMPDTYKAEWEANSDWLRLAFHARHEFPDYPYVNATYEDVKYDFDRIKKEVIRFAGEKSFALGVIPHWLPMSKEGCKALRDGGIKVMAASFGDRKEYNGDPESLPYGHSFRLLHNRQSETTLYTRRGLNTAIARSICSYNHLSEEEMAPILRNTDCVLDKETGMYFRDFADGPCLNLITIDELSDSFKPHLNYEYLGYATHEQYFYPEYFAYQSDYSAKILEAAKVVSENGYEFIFVEELV
ncbi:MAG: hypothetical protein IKV73_03815 [Clostridia bacterium]|nr:hypothetical protein [Clostridia bacterium]